MRLEIVDVTPRHLFAGIVTILAYLAYDEHDRYANFQRVDARISAINEKCYLTWHNNSGLTQTKLMGCDIAERRCLEQPKWWATMRPRLYPQRTHEVVVVYVSPVDGVTHSSSLEMDAFPKNQALRVGDVVPVVASKTEADIARWESESHFNFSMRLVVQDFWDWLGSMSRMCSTNI